MPDAETTKECKACGHSGTGEYCSHCGQSYQIKKITFSGLLQDILHLFTHFEKGFLFTVKQLIVSPGHMQRHFIEGARSRYQKPFSLFFICATLVAVSRYWILRSLAGHFQASDLPELNFVHEYMVILYISLIPVYTLITWLLFYKSEYNYAETGVFQLYMISFIFLMSGFIFLLKFIWPHLDTAYVEYPIFGIYLVITQMNFFKHFPRWEVLIKSIISITLVFLLNQITENLIIRLLS